MGREGSSFKLLTEFETSYADCKVMQWQSSKTGMRLMLLKREMPTVSGYFAVASEIDNDSGCPHTLEHLVFMGSKKYPYKGLLDMVGNRLFSNTNAWTDTDQTVYTLLTAGWEGFNSLLPVYLDHVLHPTLTDDACMTEVYHVDGNGEEKGVVFSEMQGTENTSDSILALRARQLLYSKGSGYSSETGGLMDSLRVLTNDQIRDFHKLRYRPDNLCVIIVGEVDPEELLDTMEKFDATVTPPEPGTKRPFVDSPEDPILPNSVREFVDFPETDESFGEMQLAWIGPDITDEITNIAVSALGSYFTRQGVGKFSQEMVEVMDPLATEVYYYSNDFKNTEIDISFSGVPTDRLEEAADTAIEIMKKAVDDFDLGAIRDCIERQKQRFILSNEKDPSSMETGPILSFIYGHPDGSTLEKFIKDVSDFDELLTWTKDQWVDLHKKYFIENPHVAVLARPSEKLYDKLTKEKSDRIESYKKNYGTEGLAKLGDRLNHAFEQNDQPIPKEVMDSFKAPDPAKIKFLNSTSAKAGSAVDNGPVESNAVQTKIDEDSPEGFKLHINYEHYNSHFVAIKLLLSSLEVSEKLLPYLALVISEIFYLPMILLDGTSLSYQDVVREIKKDTVELHVCPGSMFEELIGIDIQAKIENYSTMIEWIRRAFCDTIFDKDRLQVMVEKHLNSLAEEKREGTTIVASMINRTNFTTRSLKREKDILETEDFYKDLSVKLESNEGYQQVRNDLEQVRNSLFKPENLHILVSGNVEKLDHPVSAWTKLQDALPSHPGKMVKLPRSIDVYSEKGARVSGEAQITPMPATESCFVNLIGKAPADYWHEDDAAIVVCCEYLQLVEGPFWRGVRGTGLAYGAGIRKNNEDGYLTLDIYRGSDGAKAIEVTRDIVLDLANGKTEFEQESIEGAVSAIVNVLATHENSHYYSAMAKYFDDVIRKRGPNFKERFMKQLREVNKDDLYRVINQYFKPLFDSNHSMVFVSCNPSMVDSLASLLESSGYNVVINEEVADSDSEEEDAYSSEEESEDE